MLDELCGLPAGVFLVPVFASAMALLAYRIFAQIAKSLPLRVSLVAGLTALLLGLMSSATKLGSDANACEPIRSVTESIAVAICGAAAVGAMLIYVEQNRASGLAREKAILDEALSLSSKISVSESDRDQATWAIVSYRTANIKDPDVHEVISLASRFSDRFREAAPFIRFLDEMACDSPAYLDLKSTYHRLLPKTRTLHDQILSAEVAKRRNEFEVRPDQMISDCFSAWHALNSKSTDFVEDQRLRYQRLAAGLDKETSN